MSAINSELNVQADVPIAKAINNRRMKILLIEACSIRDFVQRSKKNYSGADCIREDLPLQRKHDARFSSGGSAQTRRLELT